MLHKCVGVLVLLCIGTVLAAQDKDKGKDKPKGAAAEVVKVDVKAMTLTLKVDGKEDKYTATKDTRFIGPRGGMKNTIKDKRLKPGAKIRIVADAKTLKEVHFLPATPKDKDKKKDKEK
jgi:hypothetical protein